MFIRPHAIEGILEKIEEARERWHERRSLPEETIDRLAREIHHEPGRADFRERFLLGEAGLLVAETLGMNVKHLAIAAPELDTAHPDDFHRVLEAAARTPYAINQKGEQQSYPEAAVHALHQSYAGMLSLHKQARPERAYFGEDGPTSIGYIGIGWRTELEVLSLHGPQTGVVVYSEPTARLRLLGEAEWQERDNLFIYRNRSAESLADDNDWESTRHAPSAKSTCATAYRSSAALKPAEFMHKLVVAAGLTQETAASTDTQSQDKHHTKSIHNQDMENFKL